MPLPYGSKSHLEAIRKSPKGLKDVNLMGRCRWGGGGGGTRAGGVKGNAGEGRPHLEVLWRRPKSLKGVSLMGVCRWGEGFGERLTV